MDISHLAQSGLQQYCSSVENWYILGESLLNDILVRTMTFKRCSASFLQDFLIFGYCSYQKYFISFISSVLLLIRLFSYAVFMSSAQKNLLLAQNLDAVK